MARPLLHPLTHAPLYPLGFRRDGRPFWPILGGAPDDGDGSGGDGGSAAAGGSGSGAGDASGSGNDGSDDGSPDRLKSALDKERAARKQAEKDAKAGRDAVARLAEIDEQNKDANQKAIDAATKQAREEASKETADRYRQRIVTAEIKTAAAGKLNDPADAIRLLDLDDFDLDDNDEIDGKKVEKAIADLLESKPYLGVQNAGQQRKPSFDQGNRGGNEGKPSVSAGAERYRSRKSSPSN